MRTFDYLFPGTPILPANIQPPAAEVDAAVIFIREHFAEAAESLCNVLGIVLPVPVSTSPEVVEPVAVVSPSDGWKVTGGSVTPTLPPVTGRKEVYA